LCQNKYFGRELNQESFGQTISEFFKIDPESSNFRLDVLKRIISSVEELVTVVSKLDTFRFYTTSLLITYDGDLAITQSDPLVDVRIIDFAHSTHQGLKDEIVHDGPDSGFIQGLNSLLKILANLIQQQKSDEVKKVEK
jgi:inositol-hexakisphosphate kinase